MAAIGLGARSWRRMEAFWKQSRRRRSSAGLRRRLVSPSPQLADLDPALAWSRVGSLRDVSTSAAHLASILRAP